MTTQLLATELANLVQESKRKNSDLRQVCVAIQLTLSRHILPFTMEADMDIGCREIP